MSDYTHCPDCNTPTKEAYGIGPYCPNKKCSRIDDLRPNTMIAGAGFAMMAWELACKRGPTGAKTVKPWIALCHNEKCDWCCCQMGQIYRRAESGMAAYRAAYKLGMVGDEGMRVTL